MFARILAWQQWRCSDVLNNAFVCAGRHVDVTHIERLKYVFAIVINMHISYDFLTYIVNIKCGEQRIIDRWCTHSWYQFAKCQSQYLGAEQVTMVVLAVCVCYDCCTWDRRILHLKDFLRQSQLSNPKLVDNDSERSWLHRTRIIIASYLLLTWLNIIIMYVLQQVQSGSCCKQQSGEIRGAHRTKTAKCSPMYVCLHLCIIK